MSAKDPHAIAFPAKHVPAAKNTKLLDTLIFLANGTFCLLFTLAGSTNIHH